LNPNAGLDAVAVPEYNEVRDSRVDWSKRAGYIRGRHQVEPAWADQAVTDPEACWIDPDPASASGLSVRVIGYSGSAMPCYQ
jgi:hypothetical protein